MLKVTELHAGYGRIPILNGVNLDVAEGQVLGILGHNGMGKTTLIKLLVGLLHPSSGEVNINGFTPWNRKSDFLKQISFFLI